MVIHYGSPREQMHSVSLSPARLRRWLRPQQAPAGISGQWCEGPKKSHVRTRSLPPRSLWKQQGQVFKDGTGRPPPPPTPPPWSLSPAVPGLPWRHCRLASLPRPSPGPLPDSDCRRRLSPLRSVGLCGAQRLAVQATAELEQIKDSISTKSLENSGRN